MSVQLLRRSFSVDEYHRMAEARIFGEDDRVELIEGEIVDMTPIGSRHAACVDRLAQLVFEQVRRGAIVRVQNPIWLSDRSEPQPDLALLRPRADFYAKAHPGPADVLLVVEVAETSAEVDREVKIRLYARAGIPEAWLVDLAGQCVEVCRKPTPQGYQDVQQLRRGQHIFPQAFPDLGIAVDEVLG